MAESSLLQLIVRRETVIALAVVGGVLSLFAWLLTARRAAAPAAATWCNRAAYAFMAASMLVFILAGFIRP